MRAVPVADPRIYQTSAHCGSEQRHRCSWNGNLRSNHWQVKQSQWLTKEWRTVEYQASDRCVSKVEAPVRHWRCLHL